MILTVDQLTEVWNPASLGFAAVAGLLVGYLAVGRYASDPAYASGEASASEYGWLTFALSVAVGLVFFGFQVIGSYLDADPSWTRVVSRFFIWVLYCGGIGFGTWARVAMYLRRKHAEARENAAIAMSDNQDTTTPGD